MSLARRVAQSARAVETGEHLRRQGELRAASKRFAKAIKRARLGAERGEPTAVEALTAGLIGHGRVLLALARPSEALEVFQHARHVVPDGWEPAYWVGCALAHLGDLDSAERSLTEAVAAGPAAGPPYCQRGYVRIKQGRRDGALDDLRAADRLDALDDRGRLALARLLLGRRDWSAAEHVLGRTTPGCGPAAELLLGYSLEGQGRWREACAAYEQARASTELSRTACVRLGLATMKLGDLPAARGWLEQARREGVEDDTVLYHLGWIAYQTADFDTAVSFWRAMPRHRQRLVLPVCNAHYAWAQALAERHRYDDAIPQLQAYETVRPNDLGVTRALAELHFRAAAGRGGARRDVAAVRDHLVEGCLLAPDDFRFPYYLGLLAYFDTDATGALNLLRDASARAPKDAAVSHALALTAVDAGDPTLATRTLDRALRALPPAVSHAGLRRAKAALLFRGEAWSAAANAFLALPPADRWRGPGAGECLFRSGRLDELVGVEPPDEHWRAWQARALAVQGGAAEAIIVLDRGLGRGHGDDPARPTSVLVRRLAALELARSGAWDGAASVLAQVELGVGPGSHLRLEAALMILGGNRSSAIRALGRALREYPDDHWVGHMLALALLHSIRSGTSIPDLDTPVAVALCIGAWVAVMQSADFWESWRLSTAERYATAVSTAVMADLRGALEATVREMVESPIDGADALFQREVRAAACLATFGGFPLPSPEGRTLVCGPLLVDQLGLTEQFGEFVATRAVPEPGLILRQLLARLIGNDVAGLPDLDKLNPSPDRLRRLFSQPGLVEAQVDTEGPVAALAELGRLACKNCRRERSRGHAAPSAGAVRVCESTCPRFDARNPGYAGLADKGERLQEAAALVGVEIRLDLARSAITSGTMDLDQAVSNWRAAVGLAGQIGKSDDIQASLLQTVLGRVESLRAARRWDDAVELLGAAGPVCTGEVRAQLDGRLAEALTDRGVKAGNDRRWDEAVADLRRAAGLNAYAPRPLANLAIALTSSASRHWDADRRDTAVKLLEEALDVLTDGLARMPTHPDLQRQREKVEEQLRQAINGHGVDLANADDFEGALAMLRRGLARFPSDPLLNENRRGVTLAYLLDLLNKGEVVRARRLVDQTMREASAVERQMLTRLFAGGR